MIMQRQAKAETIYSFIFLNHHSDVQQQEKKSYITESKVPKSSTSLLLHERFHILAKELINTPLFFFSLLQI